MSRELVFILGGARSGKSDFAQRIVLKTAGRVLFVATAEPGDDEMRDRIQNHIESRPEGWNTLEEPIDLETAIQSSSDGYDTLLIDCLTLWVSNLLINHQQEAAVESLILDKAKTLLELYECSSSTWVVVSNEVGLGLVPSNELGRAYRDALGRVNQLFAARADRAYFMMAGLALDLKTLGATPFDD